MQGSKRVSGGNWPRLFGFERVHLAIGGWILGRRCGGEDLPRLMVKDSVTAYTERSYKWHGA